MPTASPKSIRRRLLPHFTALMVVLPVYFGTAHIAGQPMLAVALAAATALATFLVVRLIQLRGKLTLSLTVFGFPLLIALGFACFASLDPFFERQRSADMLRDAGLGFSGRAPSELGEWRRDHDGYMLPIWLADRIGPDSMTRQSSITGDFEQLQSVRYRDLERSKLKRITLRRHDRVPAIASDFIDWINELEDPNLTLFIDHFSDEDSKALDQITTEYHLNLSIDGETSDLSKLGKVRFLFITGDRLTVEQARQISALPNISNLKLSLLQYHAESLDEIRFSHGYGYLVIDGNNLDAKAWQSLAKLPCQRLTLNHPSTGQIPNNSFRLPPADSPRRFKASPKNPADLDRLVTLFGYEHLITENTLTEKQLEKLWRHPELQAIWYKEKNGKSKRIERPRPNDDGVPVDN